MNNFDQARAAMSGLYWWGPGTLFGCEHEVDTGAVDIALAGVPHSGGNGTTERDQHLAPRAVRNVSAYYRRVHRKFGTNPWESFRVRDIGDAPMPHMLVADEASAEIKAFYDDIAKSGARPVSIGGDHSITLPILRALHAEYGPVALIQLDAHLDSYEHFGDWFGVSDSAGQWAATAVREGCVDPARSVQVGRRGNFSAFGHGNIPDLGYGSIDRDQVAEIGTKATVEQIVERVGEGPVYITFDLDVFDPAVAPAAATLEATEEGFSMRDATEILQGLLGLEVIGGDVVCLVPSKDTPNQISSFRAAAVMFEEICLVAESLRAQGKGA